MRWLRMVTECFLTAAVGLARVFASWAVWVWSVVDGLARRWL